MIRFHRLIHSLNGPVLYIDTNLNIEFVNQAFSSLTGYDSEECIGLSMIQLISTPDQARFQEIFINPDINNTKTSISLINKNGNHLQVELSVFPELEGNEVVGYSGLLTEDSIDQKENDKQIRNFDFLEIEEKYRTLYNLTFEGIIIHDRGITVDANPAFEKMMGYSREEFIGKNIVDLCVLPEFHQKIMEAMKNDETKPYEVLARRKDGVVINTEVESRRIVLNEKTVRVTAIRDITDRKAAENALIESEERYKLLSNITFEGIFVHDKGIVRDANQSLANMVGYDIDEIIGQNIIQLVVLPEYHERVASALKNEETTPYVVKVKRKDGSLFYAEVEAGMVNYKGELLRVTAARDVTWRVDAERKLRENEEELDTFFSQAGDGFFIMQMDNHVHWHSKTDNKELLNSIMANMYLTKINNAMIRQYKTTEKRIKDYTLEKFFQWNDLFGKNFTKEMLDQGFIQFEMAEPRFDNSIMWIEGNYRVLYDETGKVRGCCGVRREISDRKKAEEEIRNHNEELKKANQELDNFVYRVSHDLKAPISSAKGLIHLAQLETEHERISTCLDLIQQSMDRLDLFILDILDYSRNSRIEIEPVLIDFDQLIKDTLSHTKYLQYERRIEIEFEINDNIDFYSDKQRLVFIFNNLISNAIRFADEKKANSFLKIGIRITDEEAHIIFEDNGIGIKQEYLSRIFEMFYRATEERVGSGLGLYIVKESLEKLNGTITVSSDEDKGTKFELSIPNMKVPS